MATEEVLARAYDVLAEAGVAHAQLRRHYVEKLAEAGLLGDLAAVWEEGCMEGEGYGAADYSKNPYRRQDATAP